MKNSINTYGDNVIAKIIELTNSFFACFAELIVWQQDKKELELQYPEFREVSSGKKTGWYFLIFGLLPVSVLIDYASISSFISYLASSTGSEIMSTIISALGFLIFLILEMAVGWLILFSNKPILRIVGYVLAAIIAALPAYLTYTTYLLTPEKTEALYYKTLALMGFSVLIHAMLFLLIKEIWAGINYLIFGNRCRKLNRRNPIAKMKAIRAELQQLYVHFDRQAAGLPQEQYATLLPNRAFFLKEKLTNGVSTDDFDLSNYNPNASYIPAPQSQPQNRIGFQTAKF